MGPPPFAQSLKSLEESPIFRSDIDTIHIELFSIKEETRPHQRLQHISINYFETVEELFEAVVLHGKTHPHWVGG